MADLSEYLTFDAFRARVLIDDKGISRRTLDRYLAAGAVPGAVRLGASWAIPLSALPAVQAHADSRKLGNPSFGPGFWDNRTKRKRRKSK